MKPFHVVSSSIILGRSGLPLPIKIIESIFYFATISNDLIKDKSLSIGVILDSLVGVVENIMLSIIVTLTAKLTFPHIIEDK